MTRGPGNNPIVSVTDVVVTGGVMVVTLASTERVRADEYPASLLTLDHQPEFLAELHRMISHSDDGTILTYRTRLSATNNSPRVPEIGEEGILRGWWAAAAARAVADPSAAERVPGGSVSDYCEFCYKQLPDGPWDWRVPSALICDACYQRYVVDDQLGLRDEI